MNEPALLRPNSPAVINIVTAIITIYAWHIPHTHTQLSKNLHLVQAARPAVTSLVCLLLPPTSPPLSPPPLCQYLDLTILLFSNVHSPPPVLLSPFPPFLSLTSFSNIQKRGWSLQEFSRMPGRLKGYRRLTKGTDTAGRESLFRQVMCADTQSIQGYIHWGQLTKNNKIFWFFSHSLSQYQ